MERICINCKHWCIGHEHNTPLNDENGWPLMASVCTNPDSGQYEQEVGEYSGCDHFEATELNQVSDD